MRAYRSHITKCSTESTEPVWILTRFHQYLDVLSSDVGVNPYRKNGGPLEWVAPYATNDYRGVFSEYERMRVTGRRESSQTRYIRYVNSLLLCARRMARLFGRSGGSVTARRRRIGRAARRGHFGRSAFFNRCAIDSLDANLLST